MALELRSKKQLIVRASAAAAVGILVGLAGLAGPLPSAGLVLALASVLIAALFKGAYRWFVLSGIILLACVFVEPSPSDVLLAAAIPYGLICGAYRPRALRGASVPAALLLAYFAASLPGIASAPDAAQSLRYCLITFYLFLFALFVCTYADRTTIIPLLRAYVSAAVLSLAAGLAGLLGLFPDLLMADPYRIRGLFKDPNVYGPFFVPAVVILLDDMKRRRVLKAPSWVRAAGIALFSAAVVLSYSRAAWINLAVALAVLASFRLPSLRVERLFRVILAAGAPLACAAIFLLASPAQSGGAASFLGERAQLQEYDKDRFGAQRGGLDLILRHPFGVGAGQFENMIAGVTGEQLSAHSLYVRTAAESGVGGFLLFVSALACLVFMTRFVPSQAPEPPGGGLSPPALIAVLAGILVNSAVVDTIHWRHFWFFIGLAMYCIRAAGTKEDAHV